MPIDHPLTFFGPYTEFAGTGKEIGWPLLRDQGNSAYMRDTGDPKTAEGGHDRVGLLRGNESAPLPSARHPRKAPGAAFAVAARPRHGTDHRAARARHGADADPGRTRLQRAPFLQRASAGDDRRRPFDRREPEGEGAVVCRRHLGQGRPRHGQARRRLDDRRAHRDRPRQDRLCAASIRTMLEEKFIEGRCSEAAQKVYNPAVHPREPYADRPQRAPLALLGAREGARRLFHGARRLGARAWLRRQRAPAGEIRQPRAGARKRVGQPPFLARLQCRASRHERGLRHREPVAFRDLSTSKVPIMSS